MRAHENNNQMGRESERVPYQGRIQTTELHGANSFALALFLAQVKTIRATP